MRPTAHRRSLSTSPPRSRPRVGALLVLAVIAGLLAFAPQRTAHAADANIALGAEATKYMFGGFLYVHG